MELNSAKRLTFIANTSLLIFVTGMLGFFSFFHLTYLVYLSIPAILLYIVSYYIIHRGWLSVYVWAIYIWIGFYMCVTTICLGYNYGFHLYCMSLIPIIFCTQYIAYKLGNGNTHPFFLSLMLVIGSLASTGISLVRGPVYVINNQVATIFMVVNTLSVFGFLISYGYYIIKVVMNSEEKLYKMAHEDRLTGMYNRHYMVSFLEAVMHKNDESNWIAVVDIDNFKHFNDTYGHNFGDYVLVHLCELMQQTCEKCTIARWGGEEFLIYGDSSVSREAVLENLRSAVATTPFEFQGQSVNVTITIGTAEYVKEQSIDAWFQAADEKLYYGKNHGKNMVVK